jgi:hypothetical protein
MDFSESWYEHHTGRDHHSFQFPTVNNINMAEMRTSQVEGQ